MNDLIAIWPLVLVFQFFTLIVSQWYSHYINNFITTFFSFFLASWDKTFVLGTIFVLQNILNWRRHKLDVKSFIFQMVDDLHGYFICIKLVWCLMFWRFRLVYVRCPCPHFHGFNCLKSFIYHVLFSLNLQMIQLYFVPLYHCKVYMSAS